jgi:Organic Anion Transporter Polypeptide (OATP) family
MHAIIRSYYFLEAFNNSTTFEAKKTVAFCSAASSNMTGNDQIDCDVSAPPAPDGASSDVSRDVHPAYHVFVFAQLLSGVGSSGLHSLSLAYIDENAPRSRSAFYVGKMKRGDVQRSLTFF